MLSGERERKLLRRHRTASAFIVLACFVIVMIPAVRERLQVFFEPTLRAIHEVSAEWQKRREADRDAVTANAEIERLRTLVDGLMFDRTEYERLKHENVELREMVKYEAPEKFKTIPCGIITFDVAAERKLMTLDCGGDQGVRRGNAVLSPQGIFLGTIDVAPSGSSVVQLIKDPTSKVAAEVSGLLDAQGIVMPVGGGAVALRYLGENVKVEPASIVQTSGLLNQVPAGIPIGTIDTTAKESDTPFQRAIIDTPIDAGTLTLVNVLINI